MQRQSTQEALLNMAKKSNTWRLSVCAKDSTIGLEDIFLNARDWYYQYELLKQYLDTCSDQRLSELINMPQRDFLGFYNIIVYGYLN